jgi:hypothetical protein
MQKTKNQAMGVESGGVFFSESTAKGRSLVKERKEEFPGEQPVFPTVERRVKDGAGKTRHARTPAGIENTMGDGLDFSHIQFMCDVEIQHHGSQSVFPAVFLGAQINQDASVYLYFNIAQEERSKIAESPLEPDREGEEGDYVYRLMLRHGSRAALMMYLASIKKAQEGNGQIVFPQDRVFEAPGLFKITAKM